MKMNRPRVTAKSELLAREKASLEAVLRRKIRQKRVDRNARRARGVGHKIAHETGHPRYSRLPGATARRNIQEIRRSMEDHLISLKNYRANRSFAELDAPVSNPLLTGIGKRARAGEDFAAKTMKAEGRLAKHAIAVNRNVIKAAKKGIQISGPEIATRMVSGGRIAKKIASRVARKIPVLGAFIGAAGLASDAYAGYKAMTRKKKK